MIDKASEYLSDHRQPPTLRDIIPYDKVNGILVNGRWNSVGATANFGVVDSIESWGHGFIVVFTNGYREYYHYGLISGYAWKE